MDLLIYGIIGVFLWAAGIGLSILISSLTCNKTNVYLSTYEGLSWGLPIFLVYWLLNSEYTYSYVLPIFSEPMKMISQQPEFIGRIYAMLLITCVVTAKLYHTTDVAICVPSKDELKEFEEKLAKELKLKAKK
jgi:hypothetical protein